MSRATIVVCACDAELRSRVKEAAFTLLSEAERQQIRFADCRNDEKLIRSEIVIARNFSYGNIINAIILYDGAQEWENRLPEVERTIGRISNIYGINVRLFMLALLRDGATQTSAKEVFRNSNCLTKYLITDYNRKMQPCRMEQIEAAALVVYGIYSDTIELDGSEYTVGFGKRGASGADIQNYIQHCIADSIKRNTFKWDSNPEMLAESCWHGGMNGLRDYMIAEARGSFCYVPNNGGTYRMGDRTAKDIGNGLCGIWYENLIRETEKTPFTSAVKDFLTGDNFDKFISRVNGNLKDVSAVPSKARVPRTLFGDKSIEKYNSYLNECVAFYDDEVAALIDALREKKGEIKEKLCDINDTMSRKLNNMLADEYTVKRFESANHEMAKRLKASIQEKGFCSDDAVEGLACGDEWHGFVKRYMESVSKGIGPNALVQYDMKSLPAEIIMNVFGEIDSNADEYMAISNGVYPKAAQRIYFLARGFNADEYNKALVQMRGNSKDKVVSVNSDVYLNEEELYLFDIRAAFEHLTVFNSCFENIPEYNDEPVTEDRDAVQQAVDRTEVSPENTYAWKPKVTREDNKYILRFDWVDPGIDAIQFRVNKVNTALSALVSVKRNDYGANGSKVDITGRIDRGAYDVVLFYKGKEIGKCSFTGATSQWVFKLAKTQVNLTNGEAIYKIEIKPYTVDGRPFDNNKYELLQNISLVLNGKYKVKLPVVKKWAWTVYTDSADVGFLATGDNASDYSINIQ